MFQKKISALALISVCAAGIFAFTAYAASVELSGYAWSSNIGWVSMNCGNNASCAVSNYKVLTDSVTGDLSGHAWSSNICWVSFNRSQTGNPPSADIGAGSGPIARMNPSTNQVSGWARALSPIVAGANAGGWDGWISLSGAGYGVVLDGSDSFAWGSDVVGWVNFKWAALGAPLPPPLVSATVSAPDCIIPSGSNSCTISVSWTSTGAIVPSMRQNTVEFSTLAANLGTSRSIAFGTNIFEFFDNGAPIASDTGTASCDGVSASWNGTMCTPISFSCTGLPANAVIYSGDDAGLIANTPASFSPVNTPPKKCEFNCSGSYTWDVPSSSCVPSGTSQCSDGADNDGDGLIDFPNDPGCSSLADDNEANCGNNICESGIGGETFGNCPIDCPFFTAPR